MVLVVFPVIRLQGHAIIAHSISPVLAEISISTSWNLPVHRPPVIVDGVLFDILPRSAWGRSRASRRESFRGSVVLGSTWSGPLSIRDKNEFTVSKTTL